MIIDRARAIADDVLFPSALAVDAADRVPAQHLDLLAAEGLYGEALGDDIDLAGLGAIVEALAGGCLATAFVWIQHLTPLMATAGAGRTDLAEAFASGRRRGGIGLAGLRSPRDPMRVRRAGDGYVLDGVIPWVTGWDMIDDVYVAARDDADVIHYLLVEAVAGAGLTPSAPLELVSVRASRTVDLSFSGHVVPAERLIATQPFDEWRAEDSSGSTLNGYLSTGLAARCCRLLGPGPLDTDLAAVRHALGTAEGDDVVRARADASALAMRAASALAVATGARAVRSDQHAQRLVREATFLLVFGSRPAIKAELLARLGAAPA